MKVSFNSQEFYTRHPDLAPRNIYLAMGRIITREEIDKKFNKTFKLSFTDRCKIFVNKIKHLIKK